MTNKTSKYMNKKGAIEMSLNLIIMLIIGMVVLGLVIGFVNSLVSKGTESFDKQLGDNEKLKLDKIKSCPDVFCIDPNPSISIKKGSKINIFIKIRNVGDTELNIGAGDGTLELISGSITSEDAASNGIFILSGPGFQTPAGEETAQMYTLKVDSTTPLGTYYVPFGIQISGIEYKKVITINVE